ncbi:GH16 domain-containing protein [Mycena sanguinolenta]|uniref:GH16 domain-containing protein n=1 Tax=Mycena sanguinolenta TaxID=230812 RepID=A0A8H7CJV7_9AGAR|nr:GH16 domain-containing protein [Mycena sanguinolenta]
MITTRRAIFLLTFCAFRAAATYYPLIEYSGTTFFDGFDFYGAIDNTTWGNVTYVDAADASAESLAYVNGAGNAMIKVDDVSTVLDVGIQYRKSVRLTSQAQFEIGTLFLVDVLHMPYGCSVWPSIWLNGVLAPGQIWPEAGEVDLIEAVNLFDHNQMALHTTAGCMQPANVTQSGAAGILNCNDTSSSGCTVAETKPNSYGPGFNSNNGGVWGLQFDVSGKCARFFFPSIKFWFRTRFLFISHLPLVIFIDIELMTIRRRDIHLVLAAHGIPASVSQATPTTTMNLTDWGMPSAAYPASGCNITEFFPPQQLIIGKHNALWALGRHPGGLLPVMSGDMCKCFLLSIPHLMNLPLQFSNNVAGNGSNYADAYFEIPAIRTYTVNATAASIASASASVLLQTTGAASGSISTSTGPTGTPGGAAVRLRAGGWGVLVLLGIGVLGALL